MSDYQENTEGLEVGDMVKVVAKGLKFFHLRAFKVRNYCVLLSLDEIRRI
ncbi:unnamed protein product [Choristocarpus tenellus]